MNGASSVCRAMRLIILHKLINQYGEQRVLDALKLNRVSEIRHAGESHDPVVMLDIVELPPPPDDAPHESRDWMTEAVAAAYGLPPTLSQEIKK